MENLTEIIFGDSTNYTMSKSRLGKNEIIKFNTVFSIADLSCINQSKIILPKDIYKEEIVYDFSEEMNKLDNSIKRKNKIRVWCSHQDSDSYILLTYISNYVKGKDCNLYVIYSDEQNKNFLSPAMLREHELEELTEKEHKLTNEEIIELSNLWNKIKTQKTDMRIMEHGNVKLVSYDYFNDTLLNKLNELGGAKSAELVGHIMSNLHISDTIILYLVERLIKLNKIVIIKDDDRLWNCIIKVKNAEYSSLYKKLLTNKEYYETVNKIENIRFITDGKWDWEHGLGHYKRVAEYVNIILSQLGADERTIDLGMTAALLHDIGLVKGDKVGHALESAKIFMNYINENDITINEKEMIKQAIIDHSKGNDIKSLIGLALVLADKLDVTYHRTINSSIQDKMNKEIQKIIKVEIEISDKELIVKYTTVNQFDLKILYDWPKAITIPYKVARYLNKNYIFLINGNQIDISSFIN